MQALKQRIADFGASRKRASRKRAKPRNPSIAAHGAFVPLLAIWGTALGLGSVLVLPGAIILQIAMVTGVTGLGTYARHGLAAVAALSLGAIMFAVALALHRRAARRTRPDPVAEMLASSVRPIDPASELGSDSLDTPIDTDDNYSGADLALLAAAGVDREPVSDFKYFDDTPPAVALLADDEAATVSEAAPAEADDPREMDLAEFAEMPGRNAVWVEDSVTQDDGAAIPASAEEAPALEATADETAAEEIAAEETAATDAEPVENITAIEKLRRIPPGDLSLVQMVERFAAALHDQQAAERRNPGRNRKPGRDSALAEALKALTVLSETGFDPRDALGGEGAERLRDTTRELRDALAKLQSLRGAA